MPDHLRQARIALRAGKSKRIAASLWLEYYEALADSDQRRVERALELAHEARGRQIGGNDVLVFVETAESALKRLRRDRAFEE